MVGLFCVGISIVQVVVAVVVLTLVVYIYIYQCQFLSIIHTITSVMCRLSAAFFNCVDCGNEINLHFMLSFY